MQNSPVITHSSESHSSRRTGDSDASGSGSPAGRKPAWMAPVTHGLLPLSPVAAENTPSVSESSKETHVTSFSSMDALVDKTRKHLFAGGKSGHQTVFLSFEVQASETAAHLVGKETSERLHREISGRIRQCLPGVDALARMGDRNFIAVVDVPQGHAGDWAAQACDRLMKALRAPLRSTMGLHAISATAGYAIYPDHGSNSDELFMAAEIAAASAQRVGRGKVACFSPDLAQRARERGSMEAGLLNALEEKEFELAFQPKIQLSDGSICGVEALLRWPGRDVGPAQFIPVAEECGLITPIGEWVLKTACKTAARWAEQGNPLQISVNVSTRQFNETDFPRVVSEILNETGCDPKLIEIEVTESVLISDPKAAIAGLLELQDMGVSISIDDFGTGYSSLSYLRSLPANVIKIDRTFMQGLPEDAENSAICKAIMTLANTVGMSVVAEGVEDTSCLDYLKSIGCDQAQGYYFCKPLFEPQLIEWARARKAQASINEDLMENSSANAAGRTGRLPKPQAAMAL